MKKYQTPQISCPQIEAGVPTMLAVGLASAAAGAAAVAVSKLVGDDRTGKDISIRKIED